MKRIKSLMLLVATLLLSLSTSSSGACRDSAEKTSKLAQDYRLSVGKVRTACDTTSDQCYQRQTAADELFMLLKAANQEMLLACLFTGPNIDDSLPVTTATVTDAIGVSLPEWLPLPTFEVFVNGSDRYIVEATGFAAQISDLVVSSDTETWFTYKTNVSVSAGLVRVFSYFEARSCLASLNGDALATGAAYFSAAEAGDPVNRLEVTVNQIGSSESYYSSSCSSEFFESPNLDGYIRDGLHLHIRNVIARALARRHCGAMGAELFGGCT